MPARLRLSVVLWCAALFGSVAPFADAQQAQSRPAGLRLVLIDAEQQLGQAAAGMQEEAAAILTEAGLRVSWRDGDSWTTFADHSEGTLEIAVIVLADARRSPRGMRIMGSVPRRPGLPAAWVYARPIWRALGLRPGERPDSRDAARFAIAAGRVAVHEIVHAVAPEVPHAPEGLMRSTLDGRALTRGRPPLSDACAAALRAAWPHSYRSASTGSSAAARRAGQ